MIMGAVVFFYKEVNNSGGVACGNDELNIKAYCCFKVLGQIRFITDSSKYKSKPFCTVHSL